MVNQNQRNLNNQRRGMKLMPQKLRDRMPPHDCWIAWASQEEKRIDAQINQRQEASQAGEGALQEVRV